MDLTVVICTHNRADLLRKMLYVLSQANFSGIQNAEILVIANACKDNTPEILEHYTEVFRQLAGPPLRWLAEPVPGKSMALNLAIRESKGEMLCFIDDDQYVDTTFFQSLVTTVALYPEYEIFCGWMSPDWDGSEPSWVHESGKYHIGIRPFPEYDLGPNTFEIKLDNKLPSGGNISVRRSVFKRIDGFSTDLGPQGHNLMGGEDIEFVKRAVRAGARILYDPSIRQKHAVEAARMGTLYMMRKSYSRSLSNIMMRDDLPAGVRPYMVWKLWNLCLLVLSSLNYNRRFYYMIRMSAAIGELYGAFKKKFSLKN